MRIQSIALENFRNFDQVDLEFPEAPVLIAAAPNAVGKTSLLEAIYILMRGKSFRASHKQCVQWGKEYFSLQGRVSDPAAMLDVRYYEPKRRLRIQQDGEVVSPIVFYSRYPLVAFLPEDAFMMDRGPAGRRNFLNQSLSSMSSSYLATVVQYQRALRQRNSALKDRVGKDHVQVWTETLVNSAEVIWQHRSSLATYITTHVPIIYEKLFGGIGDVAFELMPGVDDIGRYREQLSELWEDEQRYRYTLIGPHRDDFRVTIDGRPAAAVLSRGQLRLLIVALKLASYHYIHHTTNSLPLILFDEVFSELDENRQEKLLSTFPTSQLLITSTSIPPGVKKRSDVYLLDLRNIVQRKQSVSVPAQTTVQADQVAV